MNLHHAYVLVSPIMLRGPNVESMLHIGGCVDSSLSFRVNCPCDVVQNRSTSVRASLSFEAKTHPHEPSLSETLRWMGLGLDFVASFRQESPLTLAGGRIV